MIGYTAGYISHLRRDSWSLICSIHFPSFPFPHHVPIILPRLCGISYLIPVINSAARRRGPVAAGPGVGPFQGPCGQRVITKNCFGMFGKCFYWIPFCPDESVYIYLCVCMIINHHRRVYLFHWHWKHREKNWRRWGTLSWTNRGAEVKYVQKRNHVAGKQQPAKISRTEICQRWGNAASCKREWTQRLRKMRTS